MGCAASKKPNPNAKPLNNQANQKPEPPKYTQPVNTAPVNPQPAPVVQARSPVKEDHLSPPQNKTNLDRSEAWAKK